MSQSPTPCTFAPQSICFQVIDQALMQANSSCCHALSDHRISWLTDWLQVVEQEIRPHHDTTLLQKSYN